MLLIDGASSAIASPVASSVQLHLRPGPVRERADDQGQYGSQSPVERPLVQYV
jgi:hypothetical protein